MPLTSPAAPAPSPKFWDKIAHKYARKPVSDEAAYRRKLEITRRYLRSEMAALELGCGTGSTAIAHAPFVGEILATDISGEMLEIAREKAIAEGVHNVRFQQTSLEAFDAPDAGYDVVLALSLLHLLHDRQAALAKIHRLLKPGGYFVSSTACIADRTPILKWLAPIGRRLGVFPYFEVFSEAALKGEIEAAGFKIDHCWKPEKAMAVFIVAKA